MLLAINTFVSRAAANLHGIFKFKSTTHFFLRFKLIFYRQLLKEKGFIIDLTPV
jgi:hypothetical protein